MKTNYAIAVNFDERDYPEDTCLLGWNNRYDYYDVDFFVNDILNKKNKLPDTKYGLIHVDGSTAIYVGETIEDVKSYADDARKEGIDAIVVKLEVTDDEIKVIPQ